MPLVFFGAVAILGALFGGLFQFIPLAHDTSINGNTATYLLSLLPFLFGGCVGTIHKSFDWNLVRKNVVSSAIFWSPVRTNMVSFVSFSGGFFFGIGDWSAFPLSLLLVCNGMFLMGLFCVCLYDLVNTTSTSLPNYPLS